MTALVLLRSHLYSEQVKTAYALLSHFSQASEPLLLLDISKGDIQTDIPTLRFHGDRLRKIGIELYPENRWAWFAGDYALYCAFLERPDYSHYLMIDYDVRVNFSIDRLVDSVNSSNYDLVACWAGFERDDWMWTAAGRHWFARVAGCFFPFVMLSRRLVVRCLEYRLSQSKSVPIEGRDKARFLEQFWMNCEAFVPSVALENGYAMVSLDRLVPGWTYDYFRDVDLLHWDMPEVAEVPCAHPVFLREELPDQVKNKLRDLPGGSLRDLIINRVRKMRTTDQPLWNDIVTLNPELRD